VVVDLASGDGRMVNGAARLGARGVGNTFTTGLDMDGTQKSQRHGQRLARAMRTGS